MNLLTDKDPNIWGKANMVWEMENLPKLLKLV